MADIEGGEDESGDRIEKGIEKKATDMMLGSGDYDGALALTGSYLKKDPDNVSVAPLNGVSYYRKGDYEAAAKVFQRQEDIGNDSYPVHYYLGQSYWHTKVMYRALEWYEKYLKLAAKGSKGYDFATQSVKYIKGELFMEEK